MPDAKPKFSKIRWSNTHGCYYLDEYGCIPHYAPMVLRLEDASLVVGVLDGNRFIMEVQGQPVVLERVTLAGLSAAVDTSVVFDGKAYQLEQEIAQKRRDVERLHTKAADARINFEQAVAYAEKMTRRTRPTRSVKTRAMR